MAAFEPQDLRSTIGTGPYQLLQDALTYSAGRVAEPIINAIATKKAKKEYPYMGEIAEQADMGFPSFERFISVDPKKSGWFSPSWETLLGMPKTEPTYGMSWDNNVAYGWSPDIIDTIMHELGHNAINLERERRSGSYNEENMQDYWYRKHTQQPTMLERLMEMPLTIDQKRELYSRGYPRPRDVTKDMDQDLKSLMAQEVMVRYLFNQAEPVTARMPLSAEQIPIADLFRRFLKYGARY